MQDNMGPLISADSHVEEPPGLWYDQIPGKMRGDLPPEMRPTDSETQYALAVGAKKQGELTKAELEGERHRQEVASRRTTSVEARFKVMREEGVVAECIYPTKGLYLWGIENPETEMLCARHYNDWMYDLLERRSERFRCAAMIPTRRIEDSIAEVQRCAAMGMGALMLPIVGTPPFNHKQWDPLWAAMAETGLPVVMHAVGRPYYGHYRGRSRTGSNMPTSH